MGHPIRLELTRVSLLLKLANRYSTKVGARGVMVISRCRGVIIIVVGNGYGDTSSNPGRD